jgi:transitional endoplasmic reticulum ATPase
LEKTERKLGLVFDPESWEVAMPSAVKRKTTPHSPTEQKARVEGQTQDQGNGFSMVAGMSALKEQLIHDVVGPFMNPKLYREYRVSLPNGILFYGPPGCGKTYIARSLAGELGWFFQHCQPSDIASPYIHDTVAKIRGLFALAVEKAPSVLFIDEFEAFVPARSDLGGHQQYKAEEVNEFLANLEGCAGQEVLVIAATNEPGKIDSAVRRSGRFDKLIFIPPPDAEARRAMLDFHLRGRPILAPVDTAGVAGLLDGYSASDIKLLVDEAARMALQRREQISIDTLLAALERVPASISKEDIQRYSSFRSRGSSQ